MDNKHERLLPRPEVEARCAITTGALYRAMREGRFPLALKIGARSVRWRASEIAQWIESRPRATGENGSTAAA